MILHLSKFCKINSVIVIARSPFRENSLKALNLIYQRKKVWMTDFYKKGMGGISSFLLPVLLNLANPEFRYIHAADPRATSPFSPTE